MKLIDCTVYANKPKGGIPGMLPGVWVDRAWRTQPEDVLSWSRSKLVEWAEAQAKGAAVLFDVEPIFNALEKLNHRNPMPAFFHVEQMLRVVREVRPDLQLWLYTGGRFWGYVDAREWNQHPQMLLRKILVSRLYEQQLCEGSAEECYPPRWVKPGGTRGELVHDEDRTVELMGIFFSRLRSELAVWTNGSPMMPVLGTLFLSGSAQFPMQPSTFRCVREQCSRHFDTAMVWGGVKLTPSGTLERLLEYGEHAAFFESGNGQMVKGPNG